MQLSPTCSNLIYADNYSLLTQLSAFHVTTAQKAYSGDCQRYSSLPCCNECYRDIRKVSNYHRTKFTPDSLPRHAPWPGQSHPTYPRTTTSSPWLIRIPGISTIWSTPVEKKTIVIRRKERRRRKRPIHGRGMSQPSSVFPTRHIGVQNQKGSNMGWGISSLEIAYQSIKRVG